jgi:hypothetical protein
LGHEIRQHAVEAHDRQRDRQHSEEPGEHRQQTLADEAVAETGLEDNELGDGIGITAGNLIPHALNCRIGRDARVNHECGAGSGEGMLCIWSKDHRLSLSA